MTSQDDEDPYLRHRKHQFYRRLMWFTELALKSLNCNPYAKDISEETLAKFSSLRSMLAHQKLVIDLTSTVQKKALSAKSAAFAAIRYLALEQQRGKGLANPRFLLKSYLLNFFGRSYASKRSAFLKRLFEFSMKAGNERQTKQSKLFALKYFSNSLNRSFLDFYKKLKDNKTEKLAQIKVLLSKVCLANRLKVSRAFDKLNQIVAFKGPKIVYSQNSKELLPKILPKFFLEAKGRAFNRIAQLSRSSAAKLAHAKLLSKLEVGRFANAFSKIKEKSALAKTEANFSKLLLFYQLKYASNRKTQSIFANLRKPKVEEKTQRSAKIALFQLLYNLKSKEFVCLQTLKNPLFKKSQIISGLQILISLVENRNNVFKQQFVNTVCKATSLKSSRYFLLCKRLGKIFSRKLTENLLALKKIKGISASKLFLSLKFGKLKGIPSENDVSSLKLPCLLKLANLAWPEQRQSANKNILSVFDRYLISRSAFEKNKSILEMKRAQLKLENQILKSENSELYNREKFVNMWVKELNDKNRKLVLEKSSVSAKKDEPLSSYETAENKLESLKIELDKLKSEKEHLKSEKRHLYEQLKLANEEYHSRQNFNNFAVSENVETNIPNKSMVSQGNVFQSALRSSVDRFDQRPVKRLPKKESVDMSVDESMMRKYAHDTPSPSITMKATPTLATKATEEASMRRVLDKMISDERAQLESLLLKAVEERDRTKEQALPNRQALASLKESLEALEQSLITKDMQLIDLQDKRGMVILEKTALKKNNEKAKKNLETLKVKIDQMELGSKRSQATDSNYEQFKNQYNEAFGVLKNNSSKIANFEIRIAELADLQKQLSKEIGDLKSQKSELNAQFEAHGENQKKIDEEVALKENQVADLKGRLAIFPTNGDDFESKRNFLLMHSKRFSVESELCINEKAIQEIKAEIKQSEGNLEETENAKGALIMQKFALQKQRKKIFTQLVSAKSAIQKLEKNENKSEELVRQISDSNAALSNLMGQLKDHDKTTSDVEKKISGLASKEEEFKARISALKSELESIEKANPNETFLSKENLIMTFKNQNNPAEKALRQTQAPPEPQRNEQPPTPPNPKNDASFPSVVELKKHIGERIYEITKEITENSNRLDYQKHMIGEIQLLISAKSKEIEGLKGKSEFQKLRQFQQDELIKVNCCKILDLRDEVIQDSKVLLDNKRRIAKNNALISGISQSLLSLSRKTIDTSRFIKTLDFSVQADLLSSANPSGAFASDSEDILHRLQKGLALQSDFALIQSWLPKKIGLAIAACPNYFSVRVEPGINPNNMLVDIENNYSFDENGFKFIRRESYASNDDVEISGNYEDYFSHHTNNELNVALNPESSTPSTMNYLSYNFNHEQPELDFRPKREAPLSALSKRPEPEAQAPAVRVGKMPDELAAERNRQLAVFQNQLTGIFKAKLSQAFSDLKILSSKIQLKRFLNALFNWRLASAEGRGQKLLSQAKRFRQGLFFLCHFAVQKQRLRGLGQLKLVSGLRKQAAFYKLLPVTIKGNFAHRKNLRDILHYWYKIKDDNRWYGKIIKQMVYKSALDPQIALWRLRFYRKPVTEISPHVTKALLYLIDYCQDKELENASRAFFKLSALITPVEASKEQSHISEYSIEQMSENNSFNEQQFKNENVDLPVGDYENELIERQKAKMINTFARAMLFSAARYKKLSFKFFHLLERRAMDPNLGKHRPAEHADANSGEHYLRDLQFIIEQNLKCKEELHSKNRYIELLANRLEKKDQDLFVLRNNFMFAYIDKIEKICNKQISLGRNFSLKLFFRNIK